VLHQGNAKQQAAPFKFQPDCGVRTYLLEWIRQWQLVALSFSLSTLIEAGFDYGRANSQATGVSVSRQKRGWPSPFSASLLSLSLAMGQSSLRGRYLNCDHQASAALTFDAAPPPPESRNRTALECGKRKNYCKIKLQDFVTDLLANSGYAIPEQASRNTTQTAYLMRRTKELMEVLPSNFGKVVFLTIRASVRNWFNDFVFCDR
jgi:hypothetical protein